MNSAVGRAWADFLEHKFSNLEQWIDEFDRKVQGMGEDYELSEEDIDEMANHIDDIHSCLIVNKMI